RDALESSSPKLREMLGAQGFGQVSVDISQRSFQDRSTYTPRYERASADRSAVAAPAVSSITAATPRTSLSALDAYASRALSTTEPNLGSDTGGEASPPFLGQRCNLISSLAPF